MAVKKKNVIVENIESSIIMSIVFLIRKLSLNSAFKISIIFSTIAYYVAYTTRKRIIQHLLHAKIAKDEANAKQIAFANFIHLGKIAVEFVKIDQYITTANHRQFIKWKVTPEGDKTLRSGKGIVMVGCHFGNWELSGLGYSLEYNPIMSIMRPLDNKKINAYVEARRKNYNQEICNKNEAVKTAVKALKAGKTLGILSDQHAGSGDGGKETIFFGHPARTYPTAAYLSLRLGCPLFLGFAIRNGDNFDYTINLIGPIVVKKTDDMEADVQTLTQMYTTALENEIKKSPEQWLWAHRRWLDINRGKKRNK